VHGENIERKDVSMKNKDQKLIAEVYMSIIKEADNVNLNGNSAVNGYDYVATTGVDKQNARYIPRSKVEDQLNSSFNYNTSKVRSAMINQSHDYVTSNGQPEITPQEMEAAGYIDPFTLTEDQARSIDKALDDLYGHVNNVNANPNQASPNTGYARNAIKNLDEAEKQLNTKGKLNDNTAKTILNKVQSDIGQAVDNINKSNYNQNATKIDQKQLLNYVINRSIETGENRPADTIGSSLKDYIIRITNVELPKNNSGDKLPDGDFWETDKLFRDAKVGTR